jgi:Cu/Ag efflux pump CusA
LNSVAISLARCPADDCAFACSVWLFTRLGAEFIPQLDEGDITLQFIRSSSAGLEASLDLQKKSKDSAGEFPEIREIFFQDRHGGNRHRPDGAKCGRHVCVASSA